jgi:DNA-binding protein HU-beta
MRAEEVGQRGHILGTAKELKGGWLISLSKEEHPAMATIGKTELVARMAKQTGKTVKETGEVVNATLDEIQQALKTGDEVRLVGFGSFVVRTAAAREGVNPQTRAKIKIPAKQRVRFSAGKELSDAVSK